VGAGQVFFWFVQLKKFLCVGFGFDPNQLGLGLNFNPTNQLERGQTTDDGRNHGRRLMHDGDNGERTTNYRLLIDGPKKCIPDLAYIYGY